MDALSKSSNWVRMESKGMASNRYTGEVPKYAKSIGTNPAIEEFKKELSKPKASRILGKIGSKVANVLKMFK